MGERENEREGGGEEGDIQWVKFPDMKVYNFIVQIFTCTCISFTPCMQALYYEERAGNGIGAAVAEKILEVTERIMQESSSAQPVLLRSASVEVSQ